MLGVGSFLLGLDFLALSLEQGTRLADLPQPLPQDVKAAAKCALAQVHAAGVLHGDMSLSVSAL